MYGGVQKNKKTGFHGNILLKYRRLHYVDPDGAGRKQNIIKAEKPSFQNYYAAIR